MDAGYKGETKNCHCPDPGTIRQEGPGVKIIKFKTVTVASAIKEKLHGVITVGKKGEAGSNRGAQKRLP